MSFRFSPSTDVRHVVSDAVLSVTVDRPEKRNPLSLGVLEEIRRIFTTAASDPTLKVAVIGGAGSKAFASGGDLTELSAYRSPDEAAAFSRHGWQALDAIRQFPAPVIARLQGVALGGGAELAVACDLRFAAAGASIGFIHGRLRIAPAWGGGLDLIRTVGPAKALHLMAAAAVLGAEEARALGLIDLVCPPQTVFDSWFEERLSVFREQSAQVLRAYKSIVTAARGPRDAAAERLEVERFSELWCHQDHWDAVARVTRQSP